MIALNRRQWNALTAILAGGADIRLNDVADDICDLFDLGVIDIITLRPVRGVQIVITEEALDTQYPIPNNQ